MSKTPPPHNYDLSLVLADYGAKYAWFVKFAEFAWVYFTSNDVFLMNILNVITVALFLIDIEDGKTTSPQSLPFKHPLNTPASTSASSHPSLILDRSKSVPVSINQGPSPINTPTPESIESSLQPLKVGEPSSDPPDDTFKPWSQGLADSTSSCFKKDADAPVTSTLPSQEPFISTVSENNEATCSVISVDSIDMGKNSTSSVLAESLTLFNPSSQTQDQEVDMDVSTNAESQIKLETAHDFTHQLQREEDMEDVSGAQPQLMPVPDMNLQPCHSKLATSSEHAPVHSDSEKSTESGLVPEIDQREADNNPSLAQALKELHNLLMSNSSPQGCGRSPLSDLNTPTPRQDADEVAQDFAATNSVMLDPTRDAMCITATTDDTEDGVAKADLTSQSVGEIPDFLTSSNPRNLENQSTRLVDEQKMQCPHTPEENQDLTNKDDFGLPSFKEDHDVRQFHKGQQKQNIADENTSGIDTFNSADPSQQHPLSVASGSSTDFSLEPVASPHPQTQAPDVDNSLGDSIQPGPQPSMGQFPLEHIQRIQASGFSVNEAAEALEQAQGSVELALLMLLARKITVPT